MKPQLIVQDFGGAHNADLGKARARILRGGSWKKQRIVLILPAADLIPAKVALSHWNIIFPPNQAVIRMLALGMEVGDAYSTAIEQIIAHPELSQWEYILTIEHDNCPPQDGLIQLLKDMEEHPEFACIGGLYWTKFEGGCPQLWGDPKDGLNFRPQVPIPNTVQEVCGTGMGFNLWRMSLFKDKRIKRPLFRTIAGKDGTGTQDLAFWSEARKFGHRCAVSTRVLVGHYDASTDTMW